MRADRLLSILLILQTRGRVTARRLARELEVSERTIYRDLEALSGAGVPVYTERGPGGGCALVDSYRTNLTGLNLEEVRALFMLAIPAPLAELGVGPELKNALLKLSAALPSARLQEGTRARQRIHLDPTPWGMIEEPAPHLQLLHQAIWEDLRLSILHSPRFGTSIERVVDPYGLVAKGNSWYLVAARKETLRVYPVSRLLGARCTGERFERPISFDLAEFWGNWCKASESSRPVYAVKVRAAPIIARELSRYVYKSESSSNEGSKTSRGRAISADEDDLITLVLSFESLEMARSSLLGFGRAVEVLAPEALRRSMMDFANQIAGLYSLSKLELSESLKQDEARHLS